MWLQEVPSRCGVFDVSASGHKEPSLVFHSNVPFPVVMLHVSCCGTVISQYTFVSCSISVTMSVVEQNCWSHSIVIACIFLLV